MWEPVWRAFGWLFGFLFPERATWQAIIAQYQAALDGQREHAERREKEWSEHLGRREAECAAREQEYREEIAVLKRRATNSEKREAVCQEQLAGLWKQVWQLTAVVDAIDGVRKIKEDPEFQRRQVEQVEELMRLSSPEMELPGEDPPG